MTDPANGIVLFDGVCGLCSRSVRFILRHEVGRKMRFASLQSPVGMALAARYGVDVDRLDTLVFIDGDRAYLRSEAALKIAARLALPWRLASGLRVLPRFVRDPLYRLVARHRYRWFGRLERGWQPPSNHQGRFL